MVVAAFVRVFSTFFRVLFIYLFHYLFKVRMRTSILLVTTILGYVTAQVPGFGWCPEYSPMADFDLNRYTGVWYEAERYFTVLEAGSRCVRSNYTRGIDGKFRVSNEITNRLTGIRRVLDGVVQNIGKGGEGKISVRYNTLPVPIDTQYSVLDTDYDNYAVVWSCSSLGPINTQNAWVMTRERLAPGTVLQQAYGVLDKYKISRTFFVKTDQSDCMFTDPAAIPPEINQFKKDETPEATVSGQAVPEQILNKVESAIPKEPVKEFFEQVKPVVAEQFASAVTQIPFAPFQQAENAPKVEMTKPEPVKEEPVQKIQKVSESVVNQPVKNN